MIAACWWWCGRIKSVSLHRLTRRGGGVVFHVMTGVMTNLGRASGILLIVAALAKAMNLSPFAAWLAEVGGLDGSALLVASTIVVVEAVVGGLSLWRPRLGAPFALALFIIFTIVHVRIFTDPALASCPCFGSLLPSSAAIQWGLFVGCVTVVLVQGWLVVTATQVRRDVL